MTTDTEALRAVAKEPSDGSVTAKVFKVLPSDG